MRNNGRTLSRKDLYELIWSMPATKLAKELGISDVGLGKICRRMEIPKPALGYWRKVEVGGRIPRKPRLKELSLKGQQQVTIHPSSPESESIQRIRKSESVPFPDKLVDPHRLTKKTFASFNKGKTDEKGILLSRNKIHLNIHVTHENLDRACLIMDTLVKAIELRGHKVKTEGERPLKTVVEIDGKKITISLDEKVRRIDHKTTPEETQKYKQHYWMIPRYDHIPTGILSLRIHDWAAPRKLWSDGKRQRLEGGLGSFIQGLEETAKQMKENEEKHRLDQIRWAEEKKQREERERLARVQTKKAEKLISDANSWHQAEQVRAYIRQMESLPEISAELAEWIEWATSYAKKTDPLNNSERLPFIINEHSSYC